MLAAEAPGGALVTLPAPPPRRGLDASVFAGERAVALFRDQAAFLRLVEKRSALRGVEALPAEARLTPLPAREAAKRALAQGGRVVGAVLDPGARDAFRIARWELARLASGDVLAASGRRGAPPGHPALDAECVEAAPATPPCEALFSRLGRIAGAEREVGALYLFERRPVERSKRREARLCLGVVCVSQTATELPQPLLRRIFGEAAQDLLAPDEMLVVRHVSGLSLDGGGRYRGLEPFYRVRGLSLRILVAKGLASLLQGIFAPRAEPRNPPAR